VIFGQLASSDKFLWTVTQDPEECHHNFVRIVDCLVWTGLFGKEYRSSAEERLIVLLMCWK